MCDTDKDDKEKDKEEENKTGPWGYASYDISKDDNEEQTVIYTRHESSGRINQYVDNNDGGHGHFSWKTEDEYENNNEENNTTDYSRKESNDRQNPSEGEVEEKSGCYLTSACVAHYKENFDDNCYELSILRWFRDNYVSKEDISQYYRTAPNIVKNINKEKNSNQIFNKIYLYVIVPCIRFIEDGNFKQAYDKYKKTIIALKNKYYCNIKIDNSPD